MVRVYDTQNVNGSAPEDDDDEALTAEDEDWAGEEEEHDFSNLFDAPSYADFIKTKPNSKAKSYEARVASIMKAGMVASLHNGQYADAATFLKHGPGFSKAAGNLAAEDTRAAALIEMLTAPDSPYVMFALVSIPMISQLFRNHQNEVAQAQATFRERRAEKKRQRQAGMQTPKSPPVTIHLGKRAIKLPIRVKLRMPRLGGMFKAFMGTTQHPQQIAAEVFNDPAVVAALHKMGMYPQQAAPSDQAQR